MFYDTRNRTVPARHGHTNDCDDAGALATLYALTERGEAKMLGVAVNGINTPGLHGVVVRVINDYFGRMDIPIGLSTRTAE